MLACDYCSSMCLATLTYFVGLLQVDINNLEEYISLVVDATVKTGIIRQMEAFRAGFNQVCYIFCLAYSLLCQELLYVEQWYCLNCIDCLFS